MELCECGHDHLVSQIGSHLELDELVWDWQPDGPCPICGCPEYKPRHDPRYDPDDVGDQGYSDEGFPYSGLGKVRR